LWPALSSDLKPCDVYLWGTIMQKVYKSNINTAEEMEGSFLYFPKKNFNFLESFQECV
jgi:hypothetical protein